MDQSTPSNRERKPLKVSAEICEITAKEAEQDGLHMVAQMLKDMAQKARQNGGHIEV